MGKMNDEDRKKYLLQKYVSDIASDEELKAFEDLAKKEQVLKKMEWRGELRCKVIKMEWTWNVMEDSDGVFIFGVIWKDGKYAVCPVKMGMYQMRVLKEEAISVSKTKEKGKFATRVRKWIVECDGKRVYITYTGDVWYYPHLIKKEEIPTPPRMGYREFMRLSKEAEEKWKRGDWKALRRLADVFTGALNSM